MTRSGYLFDLVVFEFGEGRRREQLPGLGRDTIPNAGGDPQADGGAAQRADEPGIELGWQEGKMRAEGADEICRAAKIFRFYATADDDDFLARLVNRVAALQAGDPLEPQVQTGPLVSIAARATGVLVRPTVIEVDSADEPRREKLTVYVKTPAEAGR